MTLPAAFLPDEQLAYFNKGVDALSPQQLIWLSGYFGGLASGTLIRTPVTTVQTPQKITILSASQSGNARRIAEQLHVQMAQAGFTANLQRTGEYKFKQLEKENLLFLITSTQGNGEPPEEAFAFHRHLLSAKAPKLPNIRFAVLGLGDSTYENFCQTAKDFHGRLLELGATPVMDRTDADVDYHAAAERWRNAVLDHLVVHASTDAAGIAAPRVARSHPMPAGDAQYTRTSPYTATLLSSQKITGRDSHKDIRHIEIDLGDSGIHYQPGDAAGIWHRNQSALIDEILEYVQLSGDASITLDDGVSRLFDALSDRFELTQNAPASVRIYASLTKDTELLPLLASEEDLKRFAHRTPLVEMFRRYPTSRINADQFLTVLRPLKPRLYSIASSQSEVGNEMHLTVSVVRYRNDARERTGGASGYLASLAEGDRLRIFVEPNDRFRLPENPDAAIIMIGAGTGIAPFRAFLQQRQSASSHGKNWLIFGNPHFTSDFLYQLELQRYAREGLLNKANFAWSRDQEDKVYVQHKLEQHAMEIWRWIDQGAYLYVCGDALRMADAVDKALARICMRHGEMTEERAGEFLTDLRAQRRYQRDVY